MLDKEEFSYRDCKAKPIGGAQTALFELVNAFVRWGYFVYVRNHTTDFYFDEGIDWQSFTSGGVPEGNLYIVNRSVDLLRLVPKQHKKILWLHNHGKYLLRPSVLLKLLRYYPYLIFSGAYHKSSFLLSFIFRSVVFPLGVSRLFLDSRIVNSHTKPKVVFTSNPLRSLKWLIDRWRKIRERVPNAELHIFSGSEVYGSWGQSVKNAMEQPLSYARQYVSAGVVLRAPVSKEDLIKEFNSCRAMFYRGDIGETFCLAVAEAQVMGIPCVVEDLGCMKERVRNGVTGYVTKYNQEFEDKCVEVLTNDLLWESMHRNLQDRSGYESWDNIALRFIKLGAH